MCGIVAAAAKREVSEILLEGLRRLEYRGYDSAGMALIDSEQALQLHKYPGKVKALEDANQLNPITGHRGVAHTRWATHGEPNATNAHPHVASNRVALVHNGIIENHALLREELRSSGVVFNSETDTEVIVHLVDAALRHLAACLAKRNVGAAANGQCGQCRGKTLSDNVSHSFLFLLSDSVSSPGKE